MLTFPMIRSDQTSYIVARLVHSTTSQGKVNEESSSGNVSRIEKEGLAVATMVVDEENIAQGLCWLCAALLACLVGIVACSSALSGVFPPFACLIFSVVGPI